MKRLLLGLVLIAALPASLAAHHDEGAPAENFLCEDEAAGRPVVRSFADFACCFEPGRNMQACVDHRLAGFAGEKTTHELLDALAAESAKKTDVEQNCHELVHAIGRRAYERSNNIGAAMHECTHQCQSGCYHGTIERMFFTDTEVSEGLQHLSYTKMRGKIRSTCAVAPAGVPQEAFMIQCTHGMGHALLYTLKYQLAPALEGCDSFDDAVARKSCYLGVFMENVVGSKAGKGDLNKDDPLYPCGTVADRYKESCYKQQTKVMIAMRKTPTDIAGLCTKTGTYQQVCFEGLGRDTSERARTGDVAAVVKICQDNAGEFLSDCAAGAARALVDFSWNARYAYRYCSALARGEERSRCFSVTQQHLRWAYGQDQEAIEEGCRMEAGPETIRCFLAAGSGVNAPWWKKILPSFFTR